MKDLNSSYEIKNMAGSDLIFEFGYKDYYFDTKLSQCSSVKVDPKGNININGNKGTFELRMTGNKNCISIPWYTIDVKGSGNGTINMQNTKQGIVLEGLNSTTSITVENDNQKKTLSCPKVKGNLLITNKKEELIVKEDSDSNGIFDNIIASSDKNLVNNNTQAVMPKILKVSSSYNSITFSWNKISGADGYLVYRKVNSGKWSSVKNTASTSYKDTKVKAGYTYTYTVKSYKKIKGKIVYSGCNKNGLSAKLTTVISLSSTSPTHVLLEWKKTLGASGYNIYRSTKIEGPYSHIKTITKGTILNYVDKKVTAGKKYYYKITPFLKRDDKTILGNSSKIQSIFIKSNKQSYIFTFLSLGCDWSTAITEDGSLWGWGGNVNGCLSMLSPVEGTIFKSPQKMLKNIKTVDIYLYDGTLLKKDGTLWCWGNNSCGQSVTDSSNICSTEPVKIMDNVKEIDSGYLYRAALKTDGSLWMWGNNDCGQIGNGTKTNAYFPVKIMDDVVSMSVGSHTSCAIKTDGSLWIWGNMYKNKPQKIMDNVKKVAVGDNHFAVILNDESLWTWGWNFHGSLGDGKKDETFRETPKKIMENVFDIKLCRDVSAAIKTDGSLWMWGNNENGNLGNGTITDQYSPECIMKNVKQISLGYFHSGAIKEDGSLWMWGNNTNSCLGNGDTQQKLQLIPTKVAQFYSD